MIKKRKFNDLEQKVHDQTFGETRKRLDKVEQRQEEQEKHRFLRADERSSSLGDLFRGLEASEF